MIKPAEVIPQRSCMSMEPGLYQDGATCDMQEQMMQMDAAQAQHFWNAECMMVQHVDFNCGPAEGDTNTNSKSVCTKLLGASRSQVTETDDELQRAIRFSLDHFSRHIIEMDTFDHMWGPELMQAGTSKHRADCNNATVGFKGHG